MLTLTLYVPLDAPFGEFARLVVIFRDAGYRIGEATFTETTAMIEFRKMGVQGNGIEETSADRA